MINLFINFYIDQNGERQKELEFCLRDNLENRLINNIFILGDQSIIPFRHQKLKFIQFIQRPTYSDFFEAINNNSLLHDINIISNSDIFFDETLQLINIKQNECYALARWNISESGSLNLFNRRDSQDVWIFRGHIPESIKGNFLLGKPGCDNRIAFEIQEAGYKITNPSLSIRTIHFHNTEIRNFNWDDESQKIQPPYLLLEPGYL